MVPYFLSQHTEGCVQHLRVERVLSACLYLRQTTWLTIAGAAGRHNTIRRQTQLINVYAFLKLHGVDKDMRYCGPMAPTA